MLGAASAAESTYRLLLVHRALPSNCSNTVLADGLDKPGKKPPGTYYAGEPGLGQVAAEEGGIRLLSVSVTCHRICPARRQLQDTIINLPSRMGGVGILSHKDCVVQNRGLLSIWARSELELQAHCVIMLCGRGRSELPHWEGMTRIGVSL